MIFWDYATAITTYDVVNIEVANLKENMCNIDLLGMFVI